MRRAARTDANQEQIVCALRKCGVFVWPTSGLGDGFPDLLAWFRGRYHLLELKDGAKPPSVRRLTRSELRFSAVCPGPVHVVTSVEEAMRAVGL